jgi:methylated-DNA-[protein]-cysteine S-methyltransferase
VSAGFTEAAMLQLTLARLASPLGELLLALDNERLCALDYADCESRMLRLLARRGPFALQSGPTPDHLRNALNAYFASELTAIEQLEVATGGTAFQARVWRALRTIPPGAPCTYGELAAQLGSRTAARAVGLANSLNPVSIVVPCHRLLGANGALTGYAGGLARKRWLLEHEQRNRHAHP